MLSWPLVLQLLSLHADAPIDLWGYDNAAGWADNFTLCGGPLQSPINIVPGANSQQGQEDIQVVFAPGLKNGEIKGANNGRDIRLNFRPENLTEPMFKFRFARRPLYGEFVLHETILHWGEGQGDHGSEHEINGKFFDAEAQMVCYDSKYGSYNEAVKHPGGVAIISAMMNGNNNGNAAPEFPLFLLYEILEELAMKGTTIHQPADLTPFVDFMKLALSKFYMYYGSLTQPPCNPVVIWLVSDAEFSMEWEFLLQLYAEIFRDETTSVKLIQNVRPIQPANGRGIGVFSSPAASIFA